MFNINIGLLFLLYFLQGIPYGIQGRFLPIYLRQHGTNLTDISFMKLIFIPWTFKTLWAFLFDAIKSKRLWLLLTMTGIAIFCGCLAFINPDDIILMTVLFLAINMCTSSQDVAVDGLAIMILPHTDLADGNVAQVVGYKTGAIVGGGGLILLSSIVSWQKVFLILFIIYFISIYIISKTLRLPQFSYYTNTNHISVVNDSTTSVIAPTIESSDKPPLTITSLALTTTDIMLTCYRRLQMMLQIPGTKWIIKFVVLYKLGEQACLSMLPLFLVDKKMSTANIGLWVGIVSDSVSIGGSVLSGWLISTHRTDLVGLLRTLCKLRLLPVIASAIIVILWQDYYEHLQFYLTVLCISTMNALLLISGMLTTSTFTAIMQCSQNVPLHSQATHYALISTLEVLSKLTFSVSTGYIVDCIGYAPSFVIFVILSMTVIPLLDCTPEFLRVHPRQQ